MVKKLLTSSRFPYIKFSVKILKRDLILEALIDTGFDGDISIPTVMILNGKPPDGHTSWILANGKAVRVPYFFGTIKLSSFKPIFVQITVLGDEPIIGRGITDQFKLIFDHGRKVIIEA